MAENKEITELKKWLERKENPTVLGGNIRTVDANVLLQHIKRNYIITKKIKK